MSAVFFHRYHTIHMLKEWVRVMCCSNKRYSIEFGLNIDEEVKVFAGVLRKYLLLIILVWIFGA
jgi:hypothetical protein